VYIRLAKRYGWLAEVNARSSHRRVTAVGAGIVLTLLLVPLVCFFVGNGLLETYWVGFALAAAVLSGLGWLDDRKGLSVRLRLCIQGLVMVGWFLLAWDQGPLFSYGLPLAALLLLGQWWFINLFNFMDGLDGFAGLEALFVMGGCLSLLWPADGVPVVYWVGFAAVAGFLVWNLPPARVFMGDAGSLMLGFWLAGPLWLLDWQALWVWLILTAVFTVDASLTLLSRLWKGERLAEAHRSHLYQRLSRHWGGHGKVLLALLGVNLGWLLPWAWLVSGGVLAGWVGGSAAYLGLAIAWICLYRLRAS